MNPNYRLRISLLAALVVVAMATTLGARIIQTETASPAVLRLPAPELKGKMSLEEALARRQSVRQFTPVPLTEQELSQLLWAAQGITHGKGHRTAPSAGATYPLELYVALASGFYHYEPPPHQLVRVSERDLRQAIHGAARNQQAVLQAPAVFVVTAVYERGARRWGPALAPRYSHLEAGHAAQNLLLEAVALGLGAVPMGGFEDEALSKALSLPADHQPLYLIPVGHPR